MVQLSPEAEDLLCAVVERAQGLAGVRLGNVFRLEHNGASGISALDQPHLDEDNPAQAWRIRAESRFFEELVRARLLETAPSGAKPSPDRSVIRAGVAGAAIHWYAARRPRVLG